MTVEPSIERRLDRLRTWNVGVGLVLAVQAVLIAVLTNNFSLPVTSTFMNGPPGTAPKLHHLFDIATGWGVFAFLAISAGALLIIATPPVFPWYKRNLLRHRNYGRWIEYFFSSSIMIVLISQLAGISDVAALLAIFGVNACDDPVRAAAGEVRGAGQRPAGCRSGSGRSPASCRGSRS